MSEIKKLLTQLKAEYDQSPLGQGTDFPSSLENTWSEKQYVKTQEGNIESSPLDSLLADVKAELATHTSQPQPPVDLLQLSPPLSQPLPQIETNVIQELQTEYQQQECLAQQNRQGQEQEQQRLEAQRQQRKRQALQQKAQDWLKRLNPNSEEGRWFEEFSYSHKSKLEAAMDYLEALRESGLR